MTHTYKGKPVVLKKAWKHKGEWYYTVRAKDPIFQYYNGWNRWGEVPASDIVEVARRVELNVSGALDALQVGG